MVYHGALEDDMENTCAQADRKQQPDDPKVSVVLIRSVADRHHDVAADQLG